jgi:hypothetical protein
MEPADATSAFLFALLTAVATGLGAVPFAFACQHGASRLVRRHQATGIKHQ